MTCTNMKDPAVIVSRSMSTSIFLLWNCGIHYIYIVLLYIRICYMYSSPSLILACFGSATRRISRKYLFRDVPRIYSTTYYYFNRLLPPKIILHNFYIYLLLRILFLYYLLLKQYYITFIYINYFTPLLLSSSYFCWYFSPYSLQ